MIANRLWKRRITCRKTFGSDTRKGLVMAGFLNGGSFADFFLVRFSIGGGVVKGEPERCRFLSFGWVSSSVATRASSCTKSSGFVMEGGSAEFRCFEEAVFRFFF